MAFAVQDRVRVKLTSAAFTGASGLLQPQPPLFGRITTLVGTTADVLTEQGDTLQALTTFLNQITAASLAFRQALLYKIVVGLASASGPAFGDAYVGRVVDVFVSDGDTRVLIKTLSNGMYYEVPATMVAILGDR
jgi:hypothetical protein